MKAEIRGDGFIHIHCETVTEKFAVERLMALVIERESIPSKQPIPITIHTRLVEQEYFEENQP